MDSWTPRQSRRNQHKERCRDDQSGAWLQR